MELKRTDSQYIERFGHFAFDEVVNEKALKKRRHTRYGQRNRLPGNGLSRLRTCS